MGFGHAIQKRIDELRRRGADVPGLITNAQRTATEHAVEKAAGMTPPNVGSEKDEPRGTNTRTAGMKSRWATDSQTEPRVDGNKYTTVLANNLQYAGYVNDGHRMDVHFVPGLAVNPHSGCSNRCREIRAGSRSAQRPSSRPASTWWKPRKRRSAGWSRRSSTKA